MAIRFRTCLTWYLVAAMLVIGVTPRAFAGFSPSEPVGLSPAERDSDLHKLRQFLEMKMVRERLKDYGFTGEEIQSRLDRLSDIQLHELALKLDDLQVGGDGGLGVLVALVAIALLVFVLVLLLQHRVVVK
jgi:hypothetical protein